ncbi:MAG: exodeoxyribonuclease VII large subunit [bacterium]
MQPLPLLEISDLNQLIQHYLEGDGIFDNLSLTGELTQVRPYHLGKQVYCYLSDGRASINAVLYASTLKRLDFELKEGLTVFVKAKLCFYPKRGSLMLQINYMSLSGEGLMKQQLAELKAKLAKEGLFDAQRKQALPLYPRRLAIITAYDSAAMWDVVKRVSLLAPLIKMTVIPATMQGQQCPASVQKALDRAETEGPFDLVLLTRGGGSVQDLAAFNDESLIRRIAACRLPCVSAIGHDIDSSLCDAVSDVFCPTPTAAADMLCAGFIQIKQRIQHELLPIGPFLLSQLAQKKHAISQQLSVATQQLSFQQERYKNALQSLVQRLEQANPLHKLKQGFSVCQDATSTHIISSIHQVTAGQALRLRVSDGQIPLKVADNF